MTYNAPVNALHYLLRHAVDIDAVLASEMHAEVNHDLIGDILEGAASFTRDVLAPLNWEGDQNPAKLVGDNVIPSPGFKEAYEQFVEAGWQSLPMSTDIGGMGLPNAIAAATGEMIHASNMAFGLCPMLSASAVKALEAHASDDLKAKYLPKMVTGEWSGAMDLTEPQAGSDLGPLTTKASPNGDGSYSVTGSRGISLFLCPKYHLKDDGSLGERNSFKPIGLEHKLGIHASPTCVMEFDGAMGWLIGEENRGLACMFTMMNEARLFVGVQGVAIGERAYQAALSYANERVQGQVINGEKGDPIIGHPDVRRMLIDIKARLMGARAICMATAAASDMSLCAGDELAGLCRRNRRSATLP